MSLAASRRSAGAASTERTGWRAMLMGPPLWANLIWLLLVVGGLLARPPLVAVDGALLSDAWWSWNVPGSGSYPQPALLFWLIHAGWQLFGVSELWARLVAPLFVLASLWLSFAAARTLWPQHRDGARFAPLLLIGTGGIVAFASQTLTDTPMIASVLMAVLGIGLIANRDCVRGAFLLAVAILGGLLLKGPLALVWLLPAALAAPWIDPQRRFDARQSGAIAIALLGAGSAWAGWLATHYGTEALIASFDFRPADDRRSWYWLPAFALLLAYPWLWWRTAWRAIGRLRRHAARAPHPAAQPTGRGPGLIADHSGLHAFTH